jgi:hypothetical protein
LGQTLLYATEIRKKPVNGKNEAKKAVTLHGEISMPKIVVAVVTLKLEQSVGPVQRRELN